MTVEKKVNQLCIRCGLALALLFTSVGSIAQTVIDKHELDEMKRKAYEYFDSYKFNYALPIYLKLDSIDPDNPSYSYPIMACYVQAEEGSKAIPYVEKCLKQRDKFPKKLIRYAATAYHLDHQFDLAINYYNEYKKTYQNKKGKVKKKHKYYISELDLEIGLCNNGLELSKNPLKIKVSSIGANINTKYPEYGPVVSADEKTLIFTSERPNTTGGKRDGVDASYNEDIYISRKQEDGTWGEPENMGDSVNTEGEDASVALSPDGQYLLVYRLHKHDVMHHSSGDLFVCELQGDVWSSPERLPDVINSPKYWEPSGSFSADDRMIVFTSDRKDGSKGGTDIWYAEKLSNGNWSIPKNMGATVNTKYDEDSPYLHPDGKTLYFCSKGHNSMGGFDIFVSKWDDAKKEWGAPKNLGFPINTAHDDIHFSWSPDGKRLYFSAIRKEGKGDKDIYVAEMPDDFTTSVMVKKGKVLDATSKKPIESKILVYDNDSNEKVGTYSSNSATGNYTIILTSGRDYRIEVSAGGYTSQSQVLKNKNLEEFQEYNKDILLKKN